jgi:LacI family transcriptional regulator
MGVSTAEDRVLGFRRAMREAQLDTPESLMFYGAYSQAGGYEMVQKALASHPKPTAIFAANNFIATGALKYLQNIGLRVPEDIAIVCFDELHPMAMAFPFFTVAAQPAYEMGQKATEMLLARLAGEAPESNQDIVLPTEIRVRQSSGAARMSETSASA